MFGLNVQGLLALFLSVMLSAGMAASGNVIGVAIARGSFEVDHSQVSGNSTIFDGADVQTGSFSSRINLNDGTRVALGPDSRAKVKGESLVLEKGLGELQARTHYQIEARTLRISPSRPNAIARVLIEGDRKVRVEAVEGPVTVLSHSGILVARVKPGAALSFEPQAAQEDTFQVEGCLLRKQGRYILVDQTSNQVVEVRGVDLTPHVCNRVKIAGTAVRGATPLAGASQVILIRTVERTATAGCLAAATQVQADPCRVQAQAPPLPAPKGESHAAVYVGVGIAAAGGIGVAVALATKGGSSK
jgi:hypothetical protein